MTTVLMPLDPSVSPQQAARVLTIRADLLPPEIRDGRRARRTRAFVLVSLALVLGLLGSWYWLAVQDLNTARDENNAAFSQLTDVQRTQQKDPEVQALIKTENGTTLLARELETVLTDDLSWANLLDLIRARAEDEDVTVSEISASLAASDAVPTTGNAVGTATVTGTAENKKVVAAYVDALSDLEDIANPFVSSISSTGGTVSFSISVTITKAALCGRLVDEDHVCPAGGK
ncbi:PilN domain-containing protein [Actinoplanes sp. NPDC023714]|uniref:PilN domain-containing protein n=1 Tax=Actinoplanes sp. NPDC023714 TaxID=3154322 RepID=UPI0033C64BFA